LQCNLLQLAWPARANYHECEHSWVRISSNTYTKTTILIPVFTVATFHEKATQYT